MNLYILIRILIAKKHSDRDIRYFYPSEYLRDKRHLFNLFRVKLFIYDQKNDLSIYRTKCFLFIKNEKFLPENQSYKVYCYRIYSNRDVLILWAIPNYCFEIED